MSLVWWWFSVVVVYFPSSWIYLSCRLLRATLSHCEGLSSGELDPRCVPGIFTPYRMRLNLWVLSGNQVSLSVVITHQAASLCQNWPVFEHSQDGLLISLHPQLDGSMGTKNSINTLRDLSAANVMISTLCLIYYNWEWRWRECRGWGFVCSHYLWHGCWEIC